MHKLDNLRMRTHHHIMWSSTNIPRLRASKAGPYMQNITRVSLHGSRAAWFTMDGPTPSLNSALWLLTSIFTTGNATTRKSTASNSGDQLSVPSSGLSSATSPSSSSSQSKSYHLKSQSRSSSPSSSSSKPKKENLSEADGKLLPEENHRRKRLGLRIICASKGHMSDKCPSRKENAQGQPVNLEPVLRTQGDEGSPSEAESSYSPV